MRQATREVDACNDKGYILITHYEGEEIETKEGTFFEVLEYGEYVDACTKCQTIWDTTEPFPNGSHLKFAFKLAEKDGFVINRYGLVSFNPLNKG